MENKEFQFNGVVMNGFLMLFVNIVILIMSIYGIISGFSLLHSTDGHTALCGADA